MIRMKKTLTKIKRFLIRNKHLLIVSVAFWVPTVLFLGLTEDVLEKGHLAFDQPSLMFLHSHASSMFDQIFLFITNFGDILAIAIIIVLLLAYVVFRQKSYRNIVLVTVGIGGAAVASVLLKLLFVRPRPELWDQIIIESTYSFPSGHSMTSAAVATVVIILFWKTRFRWIAVIAGVLFAGLIGLSRLYLGVHYPSDVLAGWSVSIAWVTLVSATIARYGNKNLNLSSQKTISKRKR